MLEKLTDKQLLEGLANNNRLAVDTLYKDNYSFIKALVTKNNGTEEDAQDLFQELLVILFHKVKEGGFELNCQLKTYLYAVARRQWLKKLNSKDNNKTKSLDDELDEPASLDDDIEQHEQKEADFEKMELGLKKIGEPCKSLLEAYYLQKKSMIQITEQFGYTNPDNAKTQKYKCLMRLKKLFFNA